MYRVELALLIVQIFLKPLIVSVLPFFVPPYWFGCLSFTLVRLGGTGIPPEEMIGSEGHILACALSQPTVRKIWCLGKSKGGGDFSFYLSKLCGCNRREPWSSPSEIGERFGEPLPARVGVTPGYPGYEPLWVLNFFASKPDLSPWITGCTDTAEYWLS